MLPETAHVLRALREKIRADMNNYADDAATGVPADFPAYRQLVGKVEGLAIAERHLLDLVDLAKNGNDDGE